MKKIMKFKYISIPTVVMLLFLCVTACKDEEVIRFPDFMEAANVRIQVDPDFSSIDASDIENAKLQFSLFSENTNIQSVVLTAQFYSFINDSLSEVIELASYSQSDFNSNQGAIRDVVFSSAFLAETFGLPGGVDDLGGGDRFDFFNTTTLTNGLVYPDTVLQGMELENVNVTPNIINSAATTSFTVGFTAFVACPVPPGFATGTYRIEQTEGPTDPFFGNDYRWAPSEVTLNVVSPIERTFNGTYLTFDNRRFNFLLICGNVLVGATSSGLSCGGPDLTWVGDSPPGTYNEADDSVIIIKVLENIDGACGISVGDPLTLTLTKVGDI
jgi:hypothetical protein